MGTTIEHVATKQQMYQLLAAGKLGNTIPQYFNIAAWGQAPYAPYWGIRSLTPGGPCFLNVPFMQVESIVAKHYLPGTYNISMMVDQITTVTGWWEIFDAPYGLYIYGIEYPQRGTSWRELMPTQGKGYSGVVARQLLRRHLNANSLDDIDELLTTYPGHVIEFSTLKNCLGTLEHRNHIIWEVRDY